MKINSNFKLRNVAGETIIIRQGTTNVDMTRIISLNSSAKLLYEQLQGKEFTLEDAAKVLTNAYGIEEEEALSGAGIWVDELHKCGVIE